MTYTQISLTVSNPNTVFFLDVLGALVAQWVKRWPTDLADRVQSLLEVKSSHP